MLMHWVLLLIAKCLSGKGVALYDFAKAGPDSILSHCYWVLHVLTRFSAGRGEL